jgi:hypothetical protein
VDQRREEIDRQLAVDVPPEVAACLGAVEHDGDRGSRRLEHTAS